MKHADTPTHVTFPGFSLEGVGNFSFLSLTQIKLDVALTSLRTPPGAAPESRETISVPERSPPWGSFQDDFLASQETESRKPW